MPDFFDRLLDEIVASAPAPASRAADVRRASRSPQGSVGWGSRRRPGRRGLLVALALLCVPAGLALAGTFDGGTISPQEWVEGRRVQPQRAIPADLSAHLSILRRPRVSADALLPWDAFTSTHSPMAANGVNPALSRRAEGFASGAAWLIPGNGRVCLIADNAAGVQMASEQLAPGASTPRNITRVPGASGTASCATAETASAGWSAGTAGTRESPGMVFTAGIVPDGVSSVTAHLDGRGSVVLPVHENLYMAEVHGWPATVSFNGPSGTVTIGNGPSVLSHLAKAGGHRPGAPGSGTKGPGRGLHRPLHVTP